MSGPFCESWGKNDVNLGKRCSKFYLNLFENEAEVMIIDTHTERNNASNRLILSQFVFKKVCFLKTKSLCISQFDYLFLSVQSILTILSFSRYFLCFCNFARDRLLQILSDAARQN